MARLNRKHNSSVYRSGLEEKTAKSLEEAGVSFEFETLRLPYIVPASDHTYTPDFIITTKTGKTIIVETKGIWNCQDRVKHLLIRQQHPELDIRFVFTRSKSKISPNSKTTYAKICEGKWRGKFKGVVWKYADKRIPEEWLNE
jgi:predicted nuclease of restriction endonuclease-like RecB superfamily